ncbi:MAG: hypothetical protein VW258_12445 [Thalassolituus sp.]
MSDSGFITEAEDEIVRPDDVVATDSEDTEAAPLAEDTEQDEFEVTVDADQQEEGEKDGKDFDSYGMALAKAEKVKKEREKRKAAERKAQELQERLDRLESQVSEVSAGPKPNADDFYGDPEGYVKALNEWEAKKKPKPQEAKQSNQAVPDVPSEILAFQYESEEKMRSQYKAYDQKQDALRAKMTAGGVVNTDAAMAELADMCIGMDGVDYATAIIGLNEVPGALDSVLRAARSGSQGLVRKHIKEAAKKVKIARRQKIETKPEPTVASTGGVDTAQARLDVLRKKWVENPRDKDASAAYFSAKREVNSNG